MIPTSISDAALMQNRFAKNGLVLHHFEADREIRTVEILCDKFHAQMILAAAEMYCPEAVAEIEEAIRLSRTLH